MTIEELKALFVADGGYSPKLGSDVLLTLAPEILALVDAAHMVEGMQHSGFTRALDAFNAKLEAL